METATRRGPGRPPKARMAQRSEQRLPQQVEGWRARRSIEEIEETGRYTIDPSMIPDGMNYQWKRLSVLGQEDREHQVQCARDGAWDAVPANRHPEIMGKYLEAENPNQAIVIGGQILMERPMVYSLEAREEEDRKAKGRVSDQFASLGLTEERGGAPRMKPQVKRDYSVQAVPDDDAPDGA